MNDLPDDQDIAERLQRLASGVEARATDPTEDVRRGRARLRRRQTLAAVGSAAAIAAVAGGAAAFAGHGGASVVPADDATVSSAVGVPTATSNSASNSAAACTISAGSAISHEDQLDDPLKSPTVMAALTSYAQILGSHLDPSGRHLQKVPTGFTGMSPSSCNPGGHAELGTKLSWTTPGQTGQAMVFVSVTNDWADDQIHLAHDHWVSLERMPDAWAATDGSAVAVRHADGTVVAIEADQTFGNNSTVGVAGFGFTGTQLLDAATDPRFALPH